MVSFKRSFNGGYLKIARYLLDHGADLNMKDENGRRLIDYYWGGGKTDKLLNEYKEHKQKQNEKLFNASWYGDLKGVKSALKHGADVNAKDVYGKTALMHASAMGYPEIVRFLLDHGANINQQSDYNETALMVALEENHPDIAEILRSRGAIEPYK